MYIYLCLETIANGYHGCWNDDTDSRLLRHKMGRGFRNIQDCAVRCMEYVYLGMEVNIRIYLLELNTIVVEQSVSEHILVGT